MLWKSLWTKNIKVNGDDIFITCTYIKTEQNILGYKGLLQRNCIVLFVRKWENKNYSIISGVPRNQQKVILSMNFVCSHTIHILYVFNVVNIRGI